MNYTAQVKNGKISLDNASTFYQNLQKLEGSKVNVIIDKTVEKPRRLKLLTYYYHGVVVKMIHRNMVEKGVTVVCNDSERPITVEDVHDYLKHKFNSSQLVSYGTHFSTAFGSSTKSLKEEEFKAYIDRITAWAKGILGISIPAVNLDMGVYYGDQSDQ